MKGKRKKQTKVDEEEGIEKESAAAGSESEAEEGASTKKKKPRIRIKLPVEKKDEGKPKRKGLKRKATRSSDTTDADSVEEPVPKKKKVDKGPRKKTAKHVSTDDVSSNGEKTNPAKSKPKADDKPKGQRSIFLNSAFWRKGRIDLDKSFSSARDHMTCKGPWLLPSDIPDEKFRDVALATMDRVKKIDKYSVFAEPVTEDEAPGYFDVVSSPMDFGTMLKKVKNNAYGKGSKAASKFYKDFLLVFDNCLTYNEEDGEIAEEASRVLGYVPEAYVNACLSVIGEE